MNKKALSSPLKILAATSVAIFSLLAVFTSTAAWFDSRRTVQNDGDDFDVQSISGRLSSITFHHLASKDVDTKTGNANAFTFNSTPSGTISYDWDAGSASFVPAKEGDTSVALETYDPLDREKPLLLMFHLDQVYETSGPAIHIDGMTNTPGFLGARTAATPTYQLDEEPAIIKTATVEGETINYYWMSSVTRFYNIVFPSDTLSWKYALNSNYAESNALPLLQDTNSRFVTVDNDNETSSFNSRATLFSSTNGQTIKNIGVVIDYYSDAIDFIYSTFLGNSILEDDYEGVLHFWCDWSMEVF